MMMRPLKDRVFITPLARLPFAGGLWVDQREFTLEVEGIVAAVGPDVSPDLRVGDHALFSWRMGQALHVAGTKYLVMREPDILAVLERTV